ncbi:cytoglobin-1-like [Synchiropus picturatus]
MSQQQMETVPGEGELERPEKPAPLTDSEKQLIQDTWSIVLPDQEKVGVAILIRFFRSCPPSKKFFRFQHMDDLAKLEASSEFATHAGGVMKAIDALVQNMDNPEKTVSKLKQLSKSHALKHKVDPVYFRILNAVIVEALTDKCGKAMTSEAGAGWTKLLATVYFHMTALYEELGWSKLATSSG